MGLRAVALAELLPYLPARKVLSLSYPDLAMSQEELAALTGFRTDAVNVKGAKWHGQAAPLPETVECFKRLGTEEFRCVDIVATREVEEKVDLNYPAELGEYDLVIDPGTVEHCFNIGQALLNAANAVRVGGIILHTPPLTMLNHGFYCLMPTLFHDFYGQNGWEILKLLILGKTTVGESPRWERFVTDPELSLLCLARRTSSAKLKIPTQTKYLQNPTLS